MSKLIRGALLAALLSALPRCGGTDATPDAGASAGHSTGGTQAGDAGSAAGGSSGAGDLAHAGSASSGEAGTSHVGGSAGTSAGGSAGTSAGGAASGLGCGATCGPNEYCRAPCSGTGFGFGGTTGLPMTPPLPGCAPLPAACNGTPTCDCICGPALGYATWCSTGSKPITSGPAVQCGCA
ncbi:MAG: hypothetical protein ABUL60_24370 [Myxococcales bacterium]